MKTKDVAIVMSTASILENLPAPWFFAGGYAIDLFLGKLTREHQDVDCCIFRDTLPQVLAFFSSWDRYIIEPSNKSQVLIDTTSFQPSPSQHELHFIKADLEIEFLLIPRRQDRVIYRRDERVSISIEDFSYKSSVPFVAPEWQLLFKAKERRNKDDLDFNNCLPHLSIKQMAWLQNALEISAPESKWLDELRSKMS